MKILPDDKRILKKIGIKSYMVKGTSIRRIVGKIRRMKTIPEESSRVGSMSIRMPSLSDSMAKVVIVTDVANMKLPKNTLPITFLVWPC